MSAKQSQYDVGLDKTAANFVPLTPLSFLARSAAVFPNHLSAVYEGKERIFMASAGSTPELIAEDDAALDAPALSPDGRMLAVRKLISQRWQLMVLDLSSRAWVQLTHGDCNAFTPSWKDNHNLLYATDCMRGLGLTALASLKIDR